MFDRLGTPLAACYIGYTHVTTLFELTEYVSIRKNVRANEPLVEYRNRSEEGSLRCEQAAELAAVRAETAAALAEAAALENFADRRDGVQAALVARATRDRQHESFERRVGLSLSLSLSVGQDAPES